MVEGSSGGVMAEGPIDFVSGAPIGGNLEVRWIHGSPSPRHNADPKIQIHAHDAHTFVLRQNKAVHYEAPFLYLFLGNDRALLLDTGATADPELFPLRETVDSILAGWLTEHPREGYELVVAHTHGHGDHVAGDVQFQDRPDTTVVAADGAAPRRDSHGPDLARTTVQHGRPAGPGAALLLYRSRDPALIRRPSPARDRSHRSAPRR